MHFFIAFVIVVVYFLASRRARVLTRHSVALGMLYGIGVYFVMNYIAFPSPPQEQKELPSKRPRRSTEKVDQ